MKIVIDIDKNYYEIIKHDVNNGMDYLPCVLIAKGTPLPKNHGRLIDAYDMKDIEFINKGDYNSTRTIREWIDSAPTIIEAESEEEE